MCCCVWRMDLVVIVSVSVAHTENILIHGHRKHFYLLGGGWLGGISSINSYVKSRM